MARRRKQAGSGYIVERPSKKHGAVYQIRWRINGLVFVTGLPPHALSRVAVV